MSIYKFFLIYLILSKVNQGVDNIDKLKYLSGVELLSDLNSEELVQIAEDVELVEYPKGSYIIRQGQEDNGYYILTEGRVEVFVNRATRKPLKLKPFQPGDGFGEIDLLSGKPSTANVYCVEPCKVLFLDAKHFAYMLVRWPKLHQSFISQLSNRLNKMNIGLWEARHRDFLRSGLMLNQLKYKFDDLWGSPATTREVSGQIEALAKTREHILLIGEKGTGQQMMSWHIHKRHFGEKAPFIVVDGRHLDRQWGDLLFDINPETVNAGMVRSGCLLEMAQGGTLFIRDINLISPRAQMKLAAALKEKAGELRVIGTVIAETEHLSVRLISELKSSFTREYKFKPLRERKRDIPVISKELLEKLARQHKRKTPVLDKEAVKLLLTYNYRRGNISELIDILERAFFLAEGETIGVDHLFFGPTGDRLGRSVNLLNFKTFKKLIKDGLLPQWLQRLSFATLVTTLLILLLAGVKAADKALVLVWGFWWPTMVISASFFGRVWCGVCPVSYSMELCKKILRLNRPIPNILKKYDYLFATFLFLLVFWTEAVTDMRFNRYYTAYWLLTITAAACVIGIVFTRHTWCRHLCPLGALVGIASISGTLEVRANSHICFNKCTAGECYRGTEKIEGCPMSQHVAYLDSNQACKMCFRCVRNCPNDSVEVNLRVPAREVWHLVRVNQGYTIFIGAALAILLPITYYEPLHRVWPVYKWIVHFSITYWGAAILAGALTWIIARPFKTKAASRRIKLVFALIPMVVAGYVAYQLHFVPDVNNILFGLGYKFGSQQKDVFYIPVLRVSQAIAAFFGFVLTGVSLIMVCYKKFFRNNLDNYGKNTTNHL